MKKVSIILLLILSLFLVSCGKETEVIEEKIVKKDFIIKTQNLEKLGNISYIDKTGKLSAKDDITISSQAMGEISTINFKEGDNVNSNAVIMKLKDSYSRYGIAINKASTGLASIKLEHENTKLRLDKAVNDATINLQRIQQDYDTTVRNIAEDKKSATLNLDNANLDDEKSIAKLNYEKLLNELEKAKLDYSNALNANQQNIDGFKRQIGTEYSNLKILYADIIDFSDKILGATDTNETVNDRFEDYLGAKNTTLTYTTKKKILDLIKSKVKFERNDFNNIEENEITEYLNEAYEGYKELNSFLSDLEEVILASVVSHSLSQTQLDGYRGAINGYQAKIQGASTGITALKNQVISFLNTYQNNEKSIEENIRILAQNVIIAQKQLRTTNQSVEIAYDKTKIANQSRLENAEIALTNAKNTLQNAINTRDVTLRTLANSIKNTEIGVFETSQEYSKLTIKTPIDGQISQILVDIGQEVSIGTPLFKMVNNNKQEVEVGFTAEQVQYIKVGDELNIIYGDKTYTGSILSISQIADNNLNYNCKIIMNEDINLLGNFVDIKVPVVNNNILLPINIVKVGQNNMANIYILENNKPKKIEVTIGKIWNDKIEILSGIENNMEIIISDIKNYDENKHTILKQ